MAGERSIGELLVREKLIDVNQLTAARKRQKESGGRLTSTLVDLGYVKDKDLANFLGQQYNLSTIDLLNFECDEEAIKMVSVQICQKNNIIPVSKADNTLVVAFSDPSNIHIKQDLALLTKCRIQVVVASETAIRVSIERYYGQKGNRFNSLMSEMEEEDFKQIKVDDAEQIDSSRVKAGDAPIVKFVNVMLEEAIKSRASDIHIEPYEKRLRIRFRIDGRLIEKIQPPKGASAAIVSRLKVISKMDIAERRRPQDGRLKVRLKNRSEIDFRVSSVPTLFGEKMVLRILDKSNLQIDMQKLGFDTKQLETLLEAIHLPQGMVLMTGPTGSGKTTTIYSCLAELNQADKNLSTAEDPVEFNLDGINQVQINPDIDFNFSDALRSFLRQDPDIIMVGEIRDLETAKVAYKAASTGHLVVSTLHTNDAASTVARLMDMGVPNFLVAEATTLVVAQRLMRTNCESCKVEYQLSDDVLLGLGIKESELSEYQNLSKGEGCSHCNETGLAGRVAVHEVMQIKGRVKESIFKEATPLEIKKQALMDGMQTLRMSALLKLKQGLTTVDEVLNTTLSDDIL